MLPRLASKGRGLSNRQHLLLLRKSSYLSRLHPRYQSTTALPTTQSALPPPLPQSTQPPPRPRRILTTSALTVLFFAAGFVMASAPAIEAVQSFTNPTTDAESLTLFQPSTPTEHEVNAYITSHPLAERLRADPSMTEARPQMKIPPTLAPHNFTAGPLMGEGKLVVPPLVFHSHDKPLPDMVQLMYFGRDLSGYPGLVHGGMLATMLDEGLARACFSALPNKVGVTANLNINYRVPCPAESYVVLKAYTTKVEGRKVWVKGWIELLGDEDQEGTKVAEAEALFIEPRAAASMAKLYSSRT